MCGFSSTNLLDVTLPDGRFIEYLTDGRHRRIAKKVNGAVVRRWVYQDQLNPTAELDGNGTVLYRYAYGSMAHSPDFVVKATGETYRVIRDQLGSPLLVVNIHDENDVLLEARYSAFGNRTVIAGDGSALTLGFAGGIYDEGTGFTRFGARDYDATVGRWTSKDPIRWGGGQGNPFAYTGNEPVNRFDPSGLYTLVGGAAAEAAAGPGVSVEAGGYYDSDRGFGWYVDSDVIGMAIPDAAVEVYAGFYTGGIDGYVDTGGFEIGTPWGSFSFLKGPDGVGLVYSRGISMHDLLGKSWWNFEVIMDPPDRMGMPEHVSCP